MYDCTVSILSFNLVFSFLLMLSCFTFSPSQKQVYQYARLVPRTVISGHLHLHYLVYSVTVFSINLPLKLQQFYSQHVNEWHIICGITGSYRRSEVCLFIQDG